MECKICKEEIKQGAKKCNHCDSFQDYRRYVNTSTTFLSLMVALVTILSFGIPYVLKTLENPDSDIKMHLIGHNPLTNEIDIYCVNEGDRPGLVHGANFEFDCDDKTYFITLRREFAKVDNKDIAKKEKEKERDLYELYPFKTVLIRYQPSIHTPPLNKNNLKEKFTYEDHKKNKIKNISLNVITTSFKGERLSKEVINDSQNIDSLLFSVLKELPKLITKK
ncbi:hypothetical protein V6R21_10195 [Limibacter armeniacum]|uniref:hypothetical protein n=1 Tax=Limibacter armeniacum TaxID=466084 RepID=UPI002FE65F26